MRATQFLTWAIVAALLMLLLILVIAAATGWRCLLDVLNWAVYRDCKRTQKRFYAGVAGMPPTGRARLPGGDPELGPALARLEAEWPRIRAELDGVLVDRDRIPPLHETYGIMFGVDKDSRKSASWPTRVFQRLVYGSDIELVDEVVQDQWKTFNLVLFGHDVPHNAARCPTTVRLMRRIPGFQSAFFSILPPGATIAPHSDIPKGVVRYHLGLKVPKDRSNCYIALGPPGGAKGGPATAGGAKGTGDDPGFVKYHWAEGQGVLFDDTYVHYVRNDTDEERVILFIDIVRPLSGVAGMVQKLADYINEHQPSVKKVLRASAVPAAAA